MMITNNPNTVPRGTNPANTARAILTQAATEIPAEQPSDTHQRVALMALQAAEGFFKGGVETVTERACLRSRRNL